MVQKIATIHTYISNDGAHFILPYRTSKKNPYDFILTIIEKLLEPPPTESLPIIRVTDLPELCPNLS